MRVTNQSLQHTTLRGLASTLAALAQAQSQAVTGRRVQTVSDDPLDASQIMRIDGMLRDIQQFTRNGTSAETRLSTEDVVLTSARDLVAKARNLALSAASAPAGDPVRQSAIDAIRGICDQLVSLGNTRVGDEYLFGGTLTTNAPFLSNGTYVGDAGVRKAEIDDGVLIDTADSGQALFSHAMGSLDNLETQLTSGTAADVQSAATDTSAAQDEMLAAQTAAGARRAAIRDTGTRLASRTSVLTDQRDGMRNVDQTEAVTRLLAAQNALEQAYAAVGRVMSVNIVDYLK
jgi:flagellar hook-associated protein 3 FlgL